MISLPNFVKISFGVPDKLLKKRTKMIIDTDAGGDDIHALLTAFHLAVQANVEIIGITCINGNSQISDGVKNIAIAQKLAGVSIPVFGGCDRNLQQKVTLSSFFFKEDGLSGHQKRYLKDLDIQGFELEKEHAVDFLIRSAIKHKDELMVVMIGALTNIACAMIKSEHFEDNVGSLICLVGNILGLGQMNEGVAEYNIHTDPEAAHLVFKALPHKLVVIPYESVISVSEYTVEQIFEQDGSAKGRFVREIYEGMKQNNNRYDIQDPMCLVLALHPHIVTEYVDRPCRVILEGEGRGMVSVKWLEHDLNPMKCVTFVLKVNEQHLLKTLSDVVK